MEKKTLATTLGGIKSNLKKNWNAPKEGEYLSLKEFSSFCVGTMGIYGFAFINSLVNFSATCYLVGAIMGITFKEIYIVNLISAILGYIMIFMSPINMLIVDNHGKLSPKTMKFGSAVSLLQIIIGAALYFVPSQSFEFIIKGFPQLLANLLVCSGVGWFFGLFVRRKFCAKHGRYKPWLIICAIPSALFISLIAFLPYEKMNHTQTLIAVHLMFTVLNIFFGSYLNNPYGMGTLMSSNLQERQKVWSIGSIITNLWSSILQIIFPIIAITTGGYLSITTYRVFVPILALVSMLIGFNVIRCHERVIEPKIARKNVSFLKSAKNVFKNKYLWIINICNLFGFLIFIVDGVMNWYFIYSLRMQWLMGFASFVAISSVGANILTPKLTNKYEKRDIYIVTRLIWAALILSLLIAIKMESIIIFLGITFVRNFVSTINGGVGSTFNADALEYHQWKTGERSDGVSGGVFGWFTAPIGMALGFVLPALLQSAGLTSDWDIMYDNAIANRVYNIHIIMSVIGLVITTLPFFFYDLNRSKLKVIVDELRLRAKIADEDSLNDLSQAQ